VKEEGGGGTRVTDVYAVKIQIRLFSRRIKGIEGRDSKMLTVNLTLAKKRMSQKVS